MILVAAAVGPVLSQRIGRLITLLLALLVLAAAPATAHEPLPAASEEVVFDCPIARASGTMEFPAADAPTPCVVILGGTMSHTRDGAMIHDGAPPRDALRRLADVLRSGGYASLRYDKVGYGASKALPGWSGTYRDEAQLAAAAIAFARAHPRVNRVIVAGESAGGYLACLAAEAGTSGDAYLFLGALCGPAEEMYEYNFGRLVRVAAGDPAVRAWAERELRPELALGRRYRALFAAAAATTRPADGDRPATQPAGFFDIVDGNFQQRVPLARRREELIWPPDQMFHHVAAPALCLAGERDRNVPPSHAARAADIMRAAGNAHAQSRLIAAADHSFQRTAPTEAAQFRERYTFESFNRPYQPALYVEILRWLSVVAPTAAVPGPTSRSADPVAVNLRAVGVVEIDPVTDTTPRRVQLAPGLEIIDDIADADATAGVETLEGRIGPLLLAEKSQAHFIEMPPGMFLADHPHSSESIIYTVRGRWVICSQGRRHEMKPGSLYRFGGGVPTGYEVPFDESAFILIFKGERTTRVEKEFIDYLRGMADRLEREHEKGTPYLLRELPPDHPARVFAREINPAWEARLPQPAPAASQPASHTPR